MDHDDLDLQSEAFIKTSDVNMADQNFAESENIVTNELTDKPIEVFPATVALEDLSLIGFPESTNQPSEAKNFVGCDSDSTASQNASQTRPDVECCSEETTAALSNSIESPLAVRRLTAKLEGIKTSYIYYISNKHDALKDTASNISGLKRNDRVWLDGVVTAGDRDVSTEDNQPNVVDIELSDLDENSIQTLCCKVSETLGELRTNFERKARVKSVELKIQVSQQLLEDMAFEPLSRRLAEELEDTQVRYVKAWKAVQSVAGSRLRQALNEAKNYLDSGVTDDDDGSALVQSVMSSFEAAVIPILRSRASLSAAKLRSSFESEVDTVRAQLISEVESTEAVSYEPFGQQLDSALEVIRLSYVQRKQELQQAMGAKIRQALFKDEDVILGVNEDDSGFLKNVSADFKQHAVSILSNRALQMLIDVHTELKEKMRDACIVKHEHIEAAQECQYEPVADALWAVLEEQRGEYLGMKDALLGVIGPAVREALSEDNTGKAEISEDFSRVSEAFQGEFEAACLPVFVERASQAIEVLRADFVSNISGAKEDHLEQVASSDELSYEAFNDVFCAQLDIIQHEYTAAQQDILAGVGPMVRQELQLREADSSGSDLENNASRLLAAIKSGFELDAVAVFLERATQELTNLRAEFESAVGATITRHMAELESAGDCAFEPVSQQFSAELTDLNSRFVATKQMIFDLSGPRVQEALLEYDLSQEILADDNVSLLANAEADFEAATFPMRYERTYREVTTVHSEFVGNIEAAKSSHLAEVQSSHEYPFEPVSQRLGTELSEIHRKYVGAKWRALHSAGSRVCQALSEDETGRAVMADDGSRAIATVQKDFEASAVPVLFERAKLALLELHSDFVAKIDVSSSRLFEETESSRKCLHEPSRHQHYAELDGIHKDYSVRKRELLESVGSRVRLALSEDDAAETVLSEDGACMLAAAKSDFPSTVTICPTFNYFTGGGFRLFC